MWLNYKFSTPELKSLLAIDQADVVSLTPRRVSVAPPDIPFSSLLGRCFVETYSEGLPKIGRVSGLKASTVAEGSVGLQDTNVDLGTSFSDKAYTTSGETVSISWPAVMQSEGLAAVAVLETQLGAIYSEIEHQLVFGNGTAPNPTGIYNITGLSKTTGVPTRAHVATAMEALTKAGVDPIRVAVAAGGGFVSKGFSVDMAGTALDADSNALNLYPFQHCGFPILPIAEYTGDHAVIGDWLFCSVAMSAPSIIVDRRFGNLTLSTSIFWNYAITASRFYGLSGSA